MLPKISIITPSFNQGRFIGSTLSSIHNQSYTNLEHIVMDGGSTDETIDILKSYDDRIFWQSKPDNGQYAAIQQGFARASGDIYGWLNSDDIYLPGALLTIGRIFRDLPEVHWITTSSPMLMDEGGSVIYRGRFPGFSRKMFLQGDFATSCGWSALGCIQQESTFWRRSLWEKVEGFPKHINYAGDLYLWNEFYKHAELYSVGMPLACFRVHSAQKSAALDKYHSEAMQIVFKQSIGTRGRLKKAYHKQRIKFLSTIGDSPKLIKRLKSFGLLRDTKYINYNFEEQVFKLEAYPR